MSAARPLCGFKHIGISAVMDVVAICDQINAERQARIQREGRTAIYDLSASAAWLSRPIEISEPERALQRAVGGMSEPELRELCALMWLGRGDFAGKTAQEALEHSRRTKAAAIPEYIWGKAPLGKYLRQGLLAVYRQEWANLCSEAQNCEVLLRHLERLFAAADHATHETSSWGQQ